MKLLMGVPAILIFASSLFAQSAGIPTTTPEAARAEFMNAKFWSKIGAYEDAKLGFTLFSRNLYPNPEGQIELWVKIAPSNPEQFRKRYGLEPSAAFVIQYATVDCSKHFLLLEKTGVYDRNNTRLSAGVANLTPKSARDRVKPGSIGAVVFESICVKI